MTSDLFRAWVRGTDRASRSLAVEAPGGDGARRPSPPPPTSYGSANPYRVLQQDPFAGDRHEGCPDLDEFPPSHAEIELAGFVIDTGLGFADLMEESIMIARAQAVIGKVTRWREAEQILARVR